MPGSSQFRSKKAAKTMERSNNQGVASPYGPKGSKAFELLTTAPLGHEAPCLACQPLDQIDIAILSVFPAKLSCASLKIGEDGSEKHVGFLSDSCRVLGQSVWTCFGIRSTVTGELSSNVCSSS